MIFMKGLDADLEKEALIEAWKSRPEELARILRDGVSGPES
jgi:hypothetical protein